MSYPQFGYPYSSAPQFLMTTNSLTTCCETSGRTLADSGAAAASAQTPVYCPVYESRLLATARHELNSAAALGVYGNPYTNTQGYGNYVTYGTEASAFYSLNSFDSKDGSGSAHAGITQAAAYYPYDHTLSQYQYDRYGTMDGGTRRKNATRETTSTLKAWLQEHRKNPYPTKEPASKEDKELGLSDLDDYDPLESESSEGELKAQAFGHVESDGCASDPCKEASLGAATLESNLERAKSCLKDPTSGPEACEAAELLSARQRSCEAKPCYQQQQQLLEANSKPRIWSLAHTATSLNQAEYPSCMLKRQQGAPSAASAVAAPAVSVIERHQKDSPVTNLRNWVDGVFHDPLFRHSTLNQALSNTTVSWATTKGSILETGALGRSLGGGAAAAAVLKGQLAGLAGAPDSSKDFLAFPKAGGKMFCS
ncbi:iroquois-class homeodomain protein IRX-4 isoform X2 [Elgaria multicarinata webbii]|uniref:iroquois-class homeodomain protein IRX-4 isoform X2 n=1 Tax=Elgaria multicarinata webbii TaxID=159646 RepID=UPI002FCD2929